MRHGRGRTAVAAVAVSSALALASVLQAQPAAAEPYPYDFPDGTRTVEGASGPGGAPLLAAEETYRSRIGPGQRLHYRVALDGSSSAYVSAVVLPGLDEQVAYGDGLKVRLQNAQGGRCGTDSTSFGTADYPRPLVASVERVAGEAPASCRAAGTYTVVVERADGGKAGSRAPWDLELDFVNEPALKGPAPSTEPEPDAPAAGPLPEGTAEERQGGTSFHEAVAIGPGVWQGRLEPGRTLFYKVPLDWGQRLVAGAELAGAGGSAPVSGALRLGVHNPARTEVAAGQRSSGGTRAAAAELDGLPAVAYENRLASAPEVRGMRFPGAYYLQITLNPELAGASGGGPREVVLRVGVEGAAEDGPAYDGDPGIFQVDAELGQGGGAGQGTGRDGGMQVVAAVGIGLGTALVLWLAVWAVVGRRRAEG
ncbi:hypothetical protein [Streptomyces indicus]|uniref:Ca-activated chloride channel family protein n=1 Tax=Streptomyces indicus TaxID=417292 RepID=A0A1G9F2Q6_9ACTN|nr:hypothetical protein [Streptomyces indicus]SDK82621.1 hypothetical protein SAMN05421806_112193 [Streptomyces indicus]